MVSSFFWWSRVAEGIALLRYCGHLLLEHDLVRKPVSTFRDHVLAEIRPAVDVDGLAGHVAGARSEQEAYGGRHVAGQRGATEDRAVDRMVRHFVWLARLGQHGRDERVDGDLVRGKLARERAGEAGDPRLRRDHMRAIGRAQRAAQAADVDDGASVTRLDRLKTGLHAMERTVEDDAGDV